MKKTLTTLLAIASLIALSMPAVAAKGGKPSKPPLGGTTCAEYSDATFEYDGDITGLELAGRSAEACVDVSDVNPGPWDVTVTVTEGTLRSLLVVLRDSVAPGDVCGEPVHYQHNTAAPATLALPLDGADGDYVNACGEDWAEWVDGHYYDGIAPAVDSPLALQVFTQGSRDLEITLNADLP